MCCRYFLVNRSSNDHFNKIWCQHALICWFFFAENQLPQKSLQLTKSCTNSTLTCIYVAMFANTGQLGKHILICGAAGDAVDMSCILSRQMWYNTEVCWKHQCKSTSHPCCLQHLCVYVNTECTFIVSIQISCLYCSFPTRESSCKLALVHFIDQEKMTLFLDHRS